MHTPWLGALWLLAASVAVQAYKQGQWIPGRATFYGGTDALIEAYRDRGIESFGIIEHGSCGYTLSDGSLPYARDMYAALADTNFDYPGSCGRCYEVRCKSGLVQDGGVPVSIEQFYYLAKVNDKVQDTYGRTFPGNPKEPQKQQYVKCWNDSASIMVRIGDSCPCQQKKPDGSVQPQFWCCGGANHMDLSYWAFEKLAHPVYGVIGIQYRPVNCLTQQPLDPVPGFVSNVIYKDDVGSGWGWRPYYSKNTQVQASGEGLDGSAATCLTSSQNGAVVFVVRDGFKPGYQPFAKASHLQFWIKSNTRSSDQYASSTPQGQPPPLKVFLMNDEKNLWCGKEVMLNEQQWRQQKGQYFQYSLPLSLFKCDESSSAKSLANVNRVDFMNVNERDADYCIDEMMLIPSKPGASDAAAAAAAAAQSQASLPPAEALPRQQLPQVPALSPHAALLNETQQQQAVVQEERSPGRTNPKQPPAKKPPAATHSAKNSKPQAKQAAASPKANVEQQRRQPGQANRQPKLQPKQAPSVDLQVQRLAMQNNNKKPAAKRAAAAAADVQLPARPARKQQAKQKAAAVVAAKQKPGTPSRKQQPKQEAAATTAVDQDMQEAMQQEQQQQRQQQRQVGKPQAKARPRSRPAKQAQNKTQQPQQQQQRRNQKPAADDVPAAADVSQGDA